MFKKYPDASINAAIVWIPILEKDTLAEAIPSAKVLSDERIQHFYDPTKAVGKAIADSVGWTGNIAWDIYLFYLSPDNWIDTPPAPKSWMHQLKDNWATNETYRTGNDLMMELSASMERLLISKTNNI